MARELYRYDDLDNSTDSIRLLKILQPAKDGSISLSLRTVRLDDVAGCYDAVSYMWGSPDASHEAIVDGRRMWLQQNIARFLTHWNRAGLADHFQKLLVDAICINHFDPREQRHQVAQMGRIYAGARQIVVWRGEPSEPDVLACYDPARTPGADGDDRSNSRPLSTENESRARAMITSRYWGRLWIIQEVTLARKVVVAMRNCLVDLQVLYDGSNPGSVWRPEGSYSSGYLQDLYYHLNQGTVRRADQLWYMIDFFRDHECPDRRDHVYGLLGMLEDATGLEVDYTSSPTMLLARTLERIANRVSISEQYDWYMEYIQKLSQVLDVRLDQPLPAKMKGSSYREPSFPLSLRVESCFAGCPQDDCATLGINAHYQVAGRHVCYVRLPRDHHERSTWKRNPDIIAQCALPSHRAGHSVDFFVMVEDKAIWLAMIEPDCDLWTGGHAGQGVIHPIPMRGRVKRLGYTAGSGDLGDGWVQLHCNFVSLVLLLKYAEADVKLQKGQPVEKHIGVYAEVADVLLTVQ